MRGYVARQITFPKRRRLDQKREGALQTVGVHFTETKKTRFRHRLGSGGPRRTIRLASPGLLIQAETDAINRQCHRRSGPLAVLGMFAKAWSWHSANNCRPPGKIRAADEECLPRENGIHRERRLGTEGPMSSLLLQTMDWSV